MLHWSAAEAQENFAISFPFSILPTQAKALIVYENRQTEPDSLHFATPSFPGRKAISRRGGRFVFKWSKRQKAKPRELLKNVSKIKINC